MTQKGEKMKLSEILKEGSNITIATVNEQGRPKSRIFSHQFIQDGKIYFCTSNEGSAFKELEVNPYAEISQFARAMYTRIGGKTIVVQGEEKKELKEIVAQNNPMLIQRYGQKGFEQKIEVLYFEEPTVTVRDFKTQSLVDIEVK